MSIEDLGEAAKILREYNALQKETIENQAEIQRGLEAAIKAKKEEIELLRMSDTQLQAEIARINEKLLSSEDISDAERKAHEQAMLRLQQLQTADNAAKQANINNIEQQKQAQEKAFNQQQESMASLSKGIAGLTAGIAGMSFSAGGVKNLAKGISDLGSGFTEATKSAGGFGNLMKSVSVSASSVGNIFVKMTGGLAKLTEFLAGKLIDTIFKQAKALDQARASTAAATVGNEKYRDSISDLYYAQEDVIHSFEDFSKAQLDLFKKMTMFSSLSKESRDGLTSINAQMERIGVNSFPDVMDIMTRAMGQSEDQAKKTSVSLIKLAADLEVPPEVIMSDFQKASGELAKYGDRMIEKFQDLAAVAKTTGVATDRLMSIAGKFDRYDSAAQSVAKLNAIMGRPYLNAVSMVRMEEDERIKVMAESIRMSGVLEQYGSRYIAQALQETMGAQSVSEVMRLVNGDMKEMAENRRKAARDKSFQESMEALKTAAIKATPLFKQLELLIERILTPKGGPEKLLAIIEEDIIPVMKDFRDALDFITNGYNLMLMVGGYALLKIVGFTAKYVAANKIASLSTNKLAKSMSGAAPSVAKNSGKMGAGFLKLAAGAIAIGGAVALAGIGIESMFNGIGDGVAKMAPHSDKLLDIALGIGAIITSVMAGLGITAFFSPFAIAGLIAFTGIIEELAETLADIPDEPFDKLAKVGNITKFIEISAQIKDTDIDRVKKLVEQANSYHKNVVKVQSGGGGPTIVDEIKSATGGGGETASSGMGPFNIYVEVGGQKLGKVVVDALNSEKNLYARIA